MRLLLLYKYVGKLTYQLPLKVVSIQNLVSFEICMCVFNSFVASMKHEKDSAGNEKKRKQNKK